MELGLEVLVVCGFESCLCHGFFGFFCQPMLATSLFRDLLDDPYLSEGPRPCLERPTRRSLGLARAEDPV